MAEAWRPADPATAPGARAAPVRPALDPFRFFGDRIPWNQRSTYGNARGYGVARHGRVVVAGICHCGPEPPCPPCPPSIACSPCAPCPPDASPSPCPPEPVRHAGARPGEPLPCPPCDRHGPAGQPATATSRRRSPVVRGHWLDRFLRRRIGRTVRVRSGPAVVVGVLARIRLCYLTVASPRRGTRDGIDFVHIPVDKVQSVTLL